MLLNKMPEKRKEKNSLFTDENHFENKVEIKTRSILLWC